MQSEIQTLECSEWPVGAWRRREPQAPRRSSWWPALAAGFLAGMLVAAGLGATGSALAPGGPQARRLAAAPPVAPELPREWRWERRPLRFDAMFREAR